MGSGDLAQDTGYLFLPDVFFNDRTDEVGMANAQHLLQQFGVTFVAGYFGEIAVGVIIVADESGQVTADLANFIVADQVLDNEVSVVNVKTYILGADDLGYCFYWLHPFRPVKPAFPVSIGANPNSRAGDPGCSR